MASTASKIDIYNMALGFVGTRMIASPNESTPEAIQCDLYWDRARRTALRDYPYSFARKRVRLAEKALPDVYIGQWRRCYGLPDQVLKVHDVHDGQYGAVSRNSWRIENTGYELVILTRQDMAVADCTFDVEDTSLWDELFVMAMARKLACLIAIPLLKNNPSKLEELEQLYQMAVPKAEGHDASEREEVSRPDSWLTARRSW
jgi:hypothetical protein